MAANADNGSGTRQAGGAAGHGRLRKRESEAECAPCLIAARAKRAAEGHRGRAPALLPWWVPDPLSGCICRQGPVTEHPHDWRSYFSVTDGVRPGVKRMPLPLRVSPANHRKESQNDGLISAAMFKADMATRPTDRSTLNLSLFIRPLRTLRPLRFKKTSRFRSSICSAYRVRTFPLS